MAYDTVPWPASLSGTPAITVIERALQRRRLSHSLLLSGEELETLVAVAHGIADRLLNGAHDNDRPPAATFAPEQHPDCFFLRPAGKMRQISADSTRELISKVQVSPNVAPRKVALIFECDRMNVAAANVFLKTLEEPPANTSLLLITTRPYSLLPTIRSRCLNFRFSTGSASFSPEGWGSWISDYKSWLEKLSGGIAEKKAATDAVFSAYGLVARFGAILETATDVVWKQQKEKLPAELADDEQVAIETGIANGLRARLFIEIEQATRQFALPALKANDPVTRRALTASIEKLEHDVGLLRVNLNESAALEDFLLSSLRFWTKR